MGSFVSHRKTVGTSVTIINSQRNLTEGMQIKALIANSGQVYIHHDENLNSINAGYELSGGDEVFIPKPAGASNMNVFAFASAADQKLCIIDV